MEAATSARVRIGAFELDLKAGELHKGARKIRLQEQPFQILLMLVERPGDLVRREEIREQLWPKDTVVEFDHSIHTAIKKLRQALGDSADNPAYIETVARRGYRLMLPVEPVESNPPEAAAATLPGQTDRGAVKPARSRWPVIAAGVSLLLLVAVGVWFTTRQPPALPQVKQRQITSESSENPVQTGSISPDGKYLAYTDTKGMHLKLVENGDAQAIPPPDALQRKKVEWEIVRWFPDGTRFLANAHVPGENADEWSSQGTSIWTLSILGVAPRSLRDNSRAYSISPDGSAISFGTNKGRLGDREIWLMDPTGDHAGKFYETDENSGILGADWSPDGKLIQYVRVDATGTSTITRAFKGGSAAPPLFPPTLDNNIVYSTWLPDGRLIYSLREPEAVGVVSCNLWDVQLDGGTGKPIGEPRRLTNWSGSCVDHLSITADGHKLAFLRWTNTSTTHVADLDASGSYLANLRHFTLSEGFDWPADWTADGKALIFSSNRTGQSGIYRQLLDEDEAQPLVIQADPVRDARVSADGKWVLYTVMGKPGEPPAPEPLMRVPVASGPTQVVFFVRPHSLILCARSPSNLCATAEPTADHKQVLITSFDPLKGRGPELTRFALDPDDGRWSMDLSPDGNYIAAVPSPAGPLCILSLHGEAMREIQVKGWSNLRSLSWAGDGKSLFVGARQHADDATLLRVDLQGNTNVLSEHAGLDKGFSWEQAGTSRAPASPDGRHLAIPSATTAQNFWMLENF